MPSADHFPWRCRARVRVAVAWAFLSIQFPAARGDYLYFQGGGAAQLPATRSGEQVRLTTPFGPRVFHISDFAAIVPETRPEQDWERRRLDPAFGTPEGAIEASWWGIEHGLVQQSVRTLRAAAASHPRDPRLVKLNALLNRLERPATPPDLSGLRATLGLDFEHETGTRVLLLHQASPERARARVEFLERLVLAHYLHYALRGTDLRVPDQALVFVWVPDRAAYRRFLRAQHAGAFHATLGYYHPSFQAVIALDAGAHAEEFLEKDATPNPQVPGDAGRRALLRDLDILAKELGTAAHEMAHLLIATSGLFPRPESVPLWLQEGLATQYEVIRGGQWAGLSRAHDLRLPVWQANAPKAKLTPLLTDQPFGRGYQDQLYADCWSLVYFLEKTRTRDFQRYLDALRLPNPEPPPGPPPEYATRLFQENFGNLRAVEIDWKHFMKVVQTPLSEYVPSQPHEITGPALARDRD